MTALATEPGTSAREALQAGACSPSCLLSTQESGRCRCTCQGAYHGILLRYITTPAQPAAKQGRTARRRARRGRKG